MFLLQRYEQNFKLPNTFQVIFLILINLQFLILLSNVYVNYEIL